MTLDEEQGFLILEKLLPTNGTMLSRNQYYDMTIDITGNSHDYVKASLLQKGYLVDGGNYIDETIPETVPLNNRVCYRISITDIGVKAYYSLKKKKCNELIQKIAFWILFAASIISAAYAVATYYTGDNTKNQQSTTKEILPMQPQLDKGHKLLTPAQNDTTNPKNNVSYYKDTAKKQ